MQLKKLYGILFVVSLFVIGLFINSTIVGRKFSDLNQYIIKHSLQFEKRITHMIKDVLLNPFGTIIRKTLSYFWNTPHINLRATVRIGNALSDGETRALEQRQIRIAKHLNHIFGISRKYIPKITLLTSGGGYRSMFMTLGFLSAAQRVGLLDLITWIGMVSASPWGVCALLEHIMQSSSNNSIAKFNEQFAQHMSKRGIKPVSSEELKSVADFLLVQAVESQALTSINLAGALLANRLLFTLPIGKRQQVYLSDQAKFIETGEWPIPIYTAVYTDPIVAENEYPWIEYTPWEIGGTWLKCYAPIWATSRTFNNGMSVDNKIEKSLGFILGMTGSAFAVRISELYGGLKDKFSSAIPTPLAQPFTKLIEETIIKNIGEQRVWWARLHNFSKGISVSPIKNKEYLDLIDAGFSFNIAYPPLSGERAGRMPDIIIIADFSKTIKGGKALAEAEQYARRHNLKFPKINYNDITSRAISVFKEPNDPSLPVVIYIPRVIDQLLMEKLQDPDFADYAQWIQVFDIEQCIQGVCTTFNMLYSYTDIMRLMKLAEFNLLGTKDIVLKEIEEVIIRKSL